MQIISLILTKFNRLGQKIIQGPKNIPSDHELFNQHTSHCGNYVRDLILFNRIKISVIIYRFIDTSTKNTYSLLPFYISPYQRHINKTIEQVLLMHFLERKSFMKISSELDLDIETIRNWVNLFKNRANDLHKRLEKKIIEEIPGYRVAKCLSENIYDIVKSIFNKVTTLIPDKKFITEYGVLSWLNLNFGV